MGKLKFALVNLWFWVAMIVMNFLTENHILMVGNNRGDFDPTSLFVFAFAAFICLFMFFFINHKDNKVKPDIILLTIITIVGFFFILAIWASPNNTYTFANGEGEIVVKITTFERFAASLILVLFLSFVYAYMYMIRVNSLRNRQFIWLLYIGIFTAYLSFFFSLILDKDAYLVIFKGLDGGSLPSISIDSFYGNKNFYGGILLIGILSCMAANFYKPRFFHYFSISLLLVALLATASMLPILISMVAVPLYLLEEIAYHAFKKKWHRSIYAVIAALILLVLLIIFYWGAHAEWDGFKGLEEYISKVFSLKNFETISGRVAIWENLGPKVFDNVFATIFGHGFMVSEKHILAITGAMNNNPLSGVRSAHNGYLQVLYEYGFLGALLHIALISYFIYSCIRLLMQKRFHFVFVYSFIMICIAVYNMAESSCLFDACVKEMYMTVAFAMPIIGDFKCSVRPSKIKEIKEMKVKKSPMDDIKLGKGIAFTISSVVFASMMMFINVQTLTTRWMRIMMLAFLFGGIILLLFVPYLVALYHRKSDKPMFILHLVGNSAVLSLIIFGTYWVLSHTQTGSRFLPFILPFVIFILLFSDLVLYAWIKGGSFKEWWKITLHGALIIPRNAYIGAFLVGGLFLLILQLFGTINVFSYIFVYCIIIALYFASFHFFPTKGGRDMLNEFNEVGLRRVQYIYYKDEI